MSISLMVTRQFHNNKTEILNGLHYPVNCECFNKSDFNKLVKHFNGKIFDNKKIKKYKLSLVISGGKGEYFNKTFETKYKNIIMSLWDYEVDYMEKTIQRINNTVE